MEDKRKIHKTMFSIKQMIVSEKDYKTVKMTEVSQAHHKMTEKVDDTVI